jgi:molecular chaperone GrpE
MMSGSESSQGPSGDTLAPVGDEKPKAEEPNYFDQLLRLKAEFENFRKRTDKERPDYIRLGRAEVLLKLLPVYDMLKSAHEQIKAQHAESELAKGMEGIFKEFQKIFKEEGVTEMEPAGKPFDALKHEVLGTVETVDLAEDCVVDVLQPGYQLGERVLRTAKVRIARKPKEAV